MHDDAVSVRCPADLPADVAGAGAGDGARGRTRRWTAATSGASTSASPTTGRSYFLEINALPSLEPGAGIYAAAALEGLHFDAVHRHGHRERGRRAGASRTRARAAASRRASGPLRVGFTYNVKRVKPTAGRHRGRGGRVRRAEPRSRRSARPSPPRDTRWSTWRPPPICPRCSRPPSPTWSSTSPRASRAATARAQVPALLELLDIPYTGSRSGDAVHRARQGAGEEDRAPARHPHAQLLHS